MKVAIIGISGYFPGANTIPEFIQNIYSGKNVTSELSQRYSTNDLKHAAELINLPVGLLQDINGFDAKFFALKEQEALSMSPQQRILLEATYHAISNANYNLEAVKDKPIGFFIGAVNDDYLEQVDFMSKDIDAYFHMGSDLSMLAGRISSYFHMTGPSQVISTACSSGIVAIHQACQSIMAGECEMAIAGGIYLVSLHRLMMHHRLGTLSVTTKSSPFSNEANGMMFGEGVALLMLKPYEAALKDNDRIYAVIEGSGINHEGGKASTAQPTVESQSALIKSIYDKYKINPENIAYLETHGTSTRKGDLVEFQALSQSFQHYTDKKQFCTLGTLKANIGHAVSASGPISLIKLIHVLNTKSIPPSVNYNSPRNEINFSDSPFKISTQVEPLAANADGPLLGALNCFGYTGTNAHIVISLPKEHKQTAKKLSDKSQQLLFYFSAADSASLSEYMNRFVGFMQDCTQPLINIAAALMEGDHFKLKLFISADNKTELLEKIAKCMQSFQVAANENEFYNLLEQHNQSEVNDITDHKIKEFIYRSMLGYKQENHLYPHTLLKEHLPDYPFHHNEFKLAKNSEPAVTSVAIETPIKKDPEPAENTLGDYKQVVENILSKVLEVEITQLDHEKTFEEMGIDSVMGIKMVNDINQALDIKLSPTVTYDYTTIPALIEYIGANYLKAKPVKPTTPVVEIKPVVSAKAEYEKTDIAIIGIACRFPKSNNHKELFNNLVNGVTAIDNIPSTRWQIDEYFDKDLTKPWKMNTKWGGFLEDYDKFDPAFFNISPKEALEMDPQQRLLLEEFWHVIEDAGYNPEKMPTDNIGIFTAAAHGDYVRNAERANYAPTGHLFVGNNLAILAGRIPYVLNFTGPALNIDTACSTSLVATHLACESLVRGECKMALVGAVTIFSTEFNFLYYTKSGMLSPDGKCKVFDDSADGFVPGEGVAAILLKPASEAVKDKDHIYAIIKATGTNQDGKTNGITAPSQKSQTELQISLFEKTHINPDTIGYVETHGTGTKLGDPIEIEALTHSFRHFTDEKQYCYIGSAKSNLGHTIMTAGIAGLIKATMAVNNKMIPPTLHIKTPNKFIDFTNSPFKLPLEKNNWVENDKHPRRALINAFGMSGTNAQAIIEEYTNAPIISSSGNNELIVISAKDQVDLENQVKQLRNHLHDIKNTPINLGSIAYTLQVGRKHFSKRLAIIVNSTEDLDRKLDDYLMHRKNDLIFDAQSQYPSTEQTTRVQALMKVAFDWLKGVECNWSTLYQETPQRVSLPGYPFKKTRYWIEVPKKAVTYQNTIVTNASVSSHKLVDNLIREIMAIEPEESDPNGSLLDYGMDSIQALTLRRRLENALFVEIPTKDIFENLTINKLKKYIDTLSQASTDNKEQEEKWSYAFSGGLVTPEFLKQEAVLPFKIDLSNLIIEKKAKPTAYLLTGSTGFIGTYMLASLLKDTKADIWCMVRGSVENGQKKIQKNLEKYELWQDNYAKRLFYVSGDLEKDNFGLDDKTYKDLSQKIDCIFHAGANINHIISYNDLKSVNVMGTVRVIKFATTEKIKPVHYISSVGTLIRRMIDTGITEVRRGEETTTEAYGLEVGYLQSKWVAEQILWEAHGQGLPVTIYRVGPTTGQSNKPFSKTDDIFHRLVTTFSKMDCYPTNWPTGPEGIVYIMPVDYLAHTFVKIMDSDYQASGFYNFMHPEPVPVIKVFEWLSKHYKPMEPVDFDVWRERCTQYLNEHEDEPGNEVMKLAFANTPYGYRFTWYFKDYQMSINNMIAAQEKLGIKTPELNEKLFNNLFAYILQKETKKV